MSRKVWRLKVELENCRVYRISSFWFDAVRRQDGSEWILYNRTRF